MFTTKMLLIKNMKMKILFLSRLAIIFNAVYLVDFLLRTKAVANTSNTGFVSLLGGWFISPILNLSLLAALILIKKPGENLPVPKWMWTLCLFFLLFQIIAFLFS